MPQGVRPINLSRSLFGADWPQRSGAGVFDPEIISYEQLLVTFWEGHDPTQGMRQGNDWGTQYRSGIYTYSDEQLACAQEVKLAYDVRLSAGFSRDYDRNFGCA